MPDPFRQTEIDTQPRREPVHPFLTEAEARGLLKILHHLAREIVHWTLELDAGKEDLPALERFLAEELRPRGRTPYGDEEAFRQHMLWSVLDGGGELVIGIAEKVAERSREETWQVALPGKRSLTGPAA